MSEFEYRVIPAPRQSKAVKGIRGVPERFAHTVGGVMNELGADGWEYVRADTLPCEERQGLTGKTVNYHSMLVFRRPVGSKVREAEPATPKLALPSPTIAKEPQSIDEWEDRVLAEAEAMAEAEVSEKRAEPKLRRVQKNIPKSDSAGLAAE
ncbi:DUF4177 domain-containing protein [Litoreibacter roseus]|uniref:Cell division protein FtsZ n=1 Tax=Litoreibacter roseus TaxID=2601869 RepID=A0A6N6JBM3_9RHOB|nr:DUF4177 domain-containing protein [Litoreibacter roseus]GFE63575.1 cell division protein FtsZ [Litoreibacter roseus]